MSDNLFTTARNIDDIMAAHEASQAQRRAGKPVWPFKANVGDLVKADEGNTDRASIARLAGNIVACLRSSLPTPWFDITNDDWDRELEDIVEAFEAIRDTKDDEDDLQAELNEWLAEMYRWGDIRRVWFGGI